MTLFDAYLMVDWSASARPRTGADSIWYALVTRDHGAARTTLVHNAPTRTLARDGIAHLLRDLVEAGKAVLVGFDFPFGYPRGFADALGLQGTPWRATWDHIAAAIADGPGNANNRFQVAASLNAALSGRDVPFWACPAGAAGAHLAQRKPDRRDDDMIAEYRLADRGMPGTQPVWKLYTAGSVGSQALMGIPMVRSLRDDPNLASVSRVWPFETGLRPLDRPRARDWRVLHAEVFPSMIPVRPGTGEVKDEVQVKALAHHFADLDGRGELGDLFHGPPELTRVERRQAEVEEGWILGSGPPRAGRGTGRRTRPLRYLRDPEEIYRRSFAMIRDEVDLARFPADTESLVIRLVHACGVADIADDLAIAEDAVAAGRRALGHGAPVLVDARMVEAGIARARLPARNRVICTLWRPDVRAAARALGTTRSAAAVDLWRPYLDGAVVAIGNAPTALFRLLELLEDGAPRPALIVGMPVGFVGAAEAKDALIERSGGIPYLTVRGRKGGSALAAAAVNALAETSP